jgi:UDP-GlcNAc:undecaprenyl-phosphate/decaprenyl-phosphate GlcNAc-1-phosphate transferase
MLANTTNFIYIFETMLAALLVSLLASWFSIQMARRTKLIDQPGSAPHKQHAHPVPLAGGIALFSTMLIVGWFIHTLDVPAIRAAMIACVPIFIFGLWDDFKNISPIVKLSGQIAAAIILINQGIYIQIFESPEFFFYGVGGIYLYLDWFVTIFWVVGITNAFNFVDSMDGLAVGLAGMAAGFFMLVTLDSGQFMLANHAAILIGACIGIFFFNSPPAILFLGDSGAQLLGFLLAVLGISYAPIGVNQSSSWLVPIMLLGVPIFDTVLVVISRLRRAKPIYAAALDHTYHRLLRMGLPSNRAVLVMQVTSLMLGCLAFVCLVQPPFIANFIFTILLIAGCAALVGLDRRSDWV